MSIVLPSNSFAGLLRRPTDNLRMQSVLCFQVETSTPPQPLYAKADFLSSFAWGPLREAY